MDSKHQRLALAAVEERLRQCFPDVDDAVVEAAVRLSHAELTGTTHDIAPLLVERAARDRLSFALLDQPEQPVPTIKSGPRTPEPLV